MASILPASVAGMNCGNGYLLNIGVKPEDEEKESVRGMAPGTIVIHAWPNNPGAFQLIDNFSNIVNVKRSYEFPKPVSANAIWIQNGTGTKWNN